jgi:hypothetical protein
MSTKVFLPETVFKWVKTSATWSLRFCGCLAKTITQLITTSQPQKRFSFLASVCNIDMKKGGLNEIMYLACTVNFVIKLKYPQYVIKYWALKYILLLRNLLGICWCKHENNDRKKWCFDTKPHLCLLWFVYRCYQYAFHIARKQA